MKIKDGLKNVQKSPKLKNHGFKKMRNKSLLRNWREKL